VAFVILDDYGSAQRLQERKLINSESFTVHGDDAGGPRIERPVRVSHEIRLFGGVAADWHVHDKPVILIVQGEQALADGFKAGV